MTSPVNAPLPAPAPEKRSALAADGVAIDYEVVGAGEPVVMLHGLWAGRAAWARQLELARRWRLVLPSMRAHDGSDGRLPPGYGIGTTELADLEAVLDAEGLDRIHLVGHSSGGTLAHAFVRRHPGRVRRLVLIEPTLLRLLDEPHRAAILAVFGGFAETARRQGDPAGVEAALTWLGGAAWARLDAGRRAARLAAMAGMRHITAPHFQSLVDFAVGPEEIAAIGAPTLLVYGGASYPFEARLAERLAALRPDWPLLVVPGAGHNCFREQPDAVNDAIAAHLDAAAG